MSSDNHADAPSSSGGSSSSQHNDASSDPFVPRPARPGYMTVGSGSTPEAASRLVSMLDDDSGYGGSLMNGESAGPGWHPNIVEDRPTPPRTPGASMTPTQANADYDRQRSHVLQLRYNQNKNALGRAIHGTIDLLKNFQKMRAKYTFVLMARNRGHVICPAKLRH